MTFQQVLTAAVADISSRGYSSEAQIAEWLRKLRRAAEAEMMSDAQVRQMVRTRLGAVYDRHLNGGLAKGNPGVGRFTIQRLEPQMRAELDRTVAANIRLIKLDQTNAWAKTEQRFTGWTSSIPKGGSDIVEKRDVKAHISKPTREERYVARRCVQDQGHKMVAAISDIVARGSGAIAGRWRHHAPRPGYQARPDHVQRNNKIYAIKDSWAVREGLIRRCDGYTDEITQPCQEVNCTCWYVYITDIEDIPEEFLTAKGREYLKMAA